MGGDAFAAYACTQPSAAGVYAPASSVTQVPRGYRRGGRDRTAERVCAVAQRPASARSGDGDGGVRCALGPSALHLGGYSDELPLIAAPRDE